MAAVNFGSLYDYNTNTGVITPITSAVKANVENAFKAIFGADLDVSDETPAGRFIEAITFLFVNVCAVNAQNANGINPNAAIGAYLDNIAALFGISRLTDETDAKFRKRILTSISRGFGYVESIWNELAKIQTLTSICVLENGNADPSVLPNDINGCAIDPHSIFVCVSGDGSEEEDLAVARAIYATKSAGCAYTDSTEYGTKVEKTITDEATGSSTLVRFYRPNRKYAKITVKVRGSAYTGTDIVADTKNSVVEFFKSRNTNDNILPMDIVAAISLSGLGIVCIESSINASADGEIYSDVDSLLLRPYEYALVKSSDIEVVLV